MFMILIFTSGKYIPLFPILPCVMICTRCVVCTGELRAIKPEATAMAIIARWPLENNLTFDWVLHTEI